MKIGFIGAGNMAKAIIAGMVLKKVCSPEEIMVSRRSKDVLEEIKEEYKVQVTTDNCEVVQWADVVVLSVKPQQLVSVIEEIRPRLKEKQLFISIAAGKTLSWFGKQLGEEVKVVRCMPNTPAMIGEGCTAFCGNKGVSEEEYRLVKQIFDSCGNSYHLGEELMDTFGAVAGSAPAYVFMFIEAMADAAVAGGIPRKTAYQIASQTVLGSAKLVLETGKHPGELKDMVCSPAGTTICGVKVLEEQGMRAAIMGALDSCIERSKKL